MTVLLNHPAITLVIIAATAWLSMWLGRATWIGRQISGVAIAIFAAVAMGNVGVLPPDGPVHDAIFAYVLPVGIALLLLRANLVEIFREAGPLLLAFLVAIVATLAGVVGALLVVDLGSDGPALAAMFAGSYIGGSLNFYAVAEVANFTRAPVVPAAVAADTLATNVYIIIAMLLPGIGWFARTWPSTGGQAAPASAPTSTVGDVRLGRALVIIALGALIAAGGDMAARAVGLPQYSIVGVTLVALVIANLAAPMIAPLKESEAIGLYALFLFLVTLGSGADVSAMMGKAAPVAVFAVLVLAIHLVVLLALGKALKLSLPELLIASNAAVGGSSSAGPIAAARGWHHLVTPGILVGALGNAGATFIGVTLYEVLA